MEMSVSLSVIVKPVAHLRRSTAEANKALFTVTKAESEESGVSELLSSAPLEVQANQTIKHFFFERVKSA